MKWTGLRPAVVLVVACTGATPAVDRACPDAVTSYRVLVFTRTTAFRHASIPAGVSALQELGASNDFDVQATEDPTLFVDARLECYAAVVFLNTTGDVLTEAQQEAFERYIARGGGFVGVHSASDSEYEWAWYHQLLGVVFANHSDIVSATVWVTDAAHASTRSLPDPWVRTDEWYNYESNPPPAVTVLARVDESTYTGGQMGAFHPISWQHTFGGGRAWYTAMGHTEGSYEEPEFRKHLLGGILFAAGIDS